MLQYLYIRVTVYGSFPFVIVLYEYYLHLINLVTNTYIYVRRSDDVSASSATLSRPLEWIELLRKRE